MTTAEFAAYGGLHAIDIVHILAFALHSNGVRQWMSDGTAAK
jgi:hypothetical protein